jgi:methylmalonyl-CoA/ethylmalonyl-CoA epimerase
VATDGTGISELGEAIDKFRARGGDEPAARRRTRAEWRLREVLGRAFMDDVLTRVLAPGEFDRMLEQIAARELDPYTGSAAIMTRALGRPSSPGTLDHVGIAVGDAPGFVALVSRLFGLATGEPEKVGQHQVRFVDTGDATIELVEALAPDAPVGKFLEARGTSLHHVCLRVPDIDAALARLREQGVRFIDERPRAGAHGSRIAFLHPSSTAGILVELKEPARVPHAGRPPA